MASGRKQFFATRLHQRRAPGLIPTAAIAAALVCAPCTKLAAQQAANPLYATGDAAVTGFSSALPPAQIAPGVDPGGLTFIDVNGPSLRIVDLRHLGGAPNAQLVGAAKPYTAIAGSIGQVFGVALDDNTPPNIYAAATSAYGLPIVAPGPDGKPRHIKTGAPNASFMSGLWGQTGSPGTIWKIDGATGKISRFADVTFDGRANSGAALGGLAYDPESKSLYVADRESGLIARYGLDGRAIDRYDHGTAGRDAQSLPPVTSNMQARVDVTSPQFDSTDPATWNYAPPERRVFGLTVHEHRLYYAVADGLQIWSVGLKPDGAFDSDAMIELAVPPAAGPTEISKITFDEQGRMFLAERAAPSGAFDLEALAVPGIGRVLRYAVVGHAANGRRIWQELPAEYAIGFPADLRNGNGGVAIGYSYDAKGEIVPGSCGGYMWATGEQLRHASDPTLAAQLAQSRPLDVNGLQGNGTWQVRPSNAPPLQSYFIEYLDEADDDLARGSMGDIAIARDCTPAVRPGLQIPGQPPGSLPPRSQKPPGNHPPATPPGGNPPGLCPPDQVRSARTGACGACARPDIQIGGKCCVVGALAAGGACSNSSCQSGQTAIGPSNFCCNSSQVYAGSGGAQACCSGQVVNGKCQPPTPPKTTCGTGYVPSGNACCLQSQMTSTGVCCPSGQIPIGPNKNACGIPIHIPIGPHCCPSGKVPTGDGNCCVPTNVTSRGACCPGGVDPKNHAQCLALTPKPPVLTCAPGYTRMSDGTCCNNRNIGDDGMSCKINRQACAPGEFRDLNGQCAAMPTTPCPDGEARNREGICVGGGGSTPPSTVGPGRPLEPVQPVEPPPRRGVGRPGGLRPPPPPPPPRGRILRNPRGGKPGLLNR